jgi:hypothetical protein
MKRRASQANDPEFQGFRAGSGYWKIKPLSAKVLM